MTRQWLPVVAVLVLAGMAWADAKKGPTPQALKGTWVREVNNTKISFTFKDGKTFRCVLKPEGADDGPTIDCDYTLGKNGVMEFVITEIDKKGVDNLPNKGDKFSFKLETGKEKLTISDFKGGDSPEAKQLVEGEYSKKTD
ncbi:MAG: hypothetical protein ACJ8F7_19525 [Gemmataceae bacterium]